MENKCLNLTHLLKKGYDTELMVMLKNCCLKK